MFNITDQEAMVTPAPYAPNALDPNCHVFEIEVEKYFDTGDLVFTTPGTNEMMTIGLQKVSSRTGAI